MKPIGSIFAFATILTTSCATLTKREAYYDELVQEIRSAARADFEKEGCLLLSEYQNAPLYARGEVTMCFNLACSITSPEYRGYTIGCITRSKGLFGGRSQSIDLHKQYVW